MTVVTERDPMSEESMRYDEFLEQIGDGLLSTQDFLEILEEAAESELQTLEDRAAWATRANVPSRASVEAYNVRFVLDRLNDATWPCSPRWCV